MTSLGHLVSQESTDCGQSALGGAVLGNGELALINRANINPGVVHVVFRDLQQSFGGFQGILLTPVEVFLASFNFPFVIGSLGVKLLSSVVNSPSLDEPILGQNATSVSAIAAETTILLLREIQESLV